MESLLIGSFPKSLKMLPLPVKAELQFKGGISRKSEKFKTRSIRAIQITKCKAWNTTEKNESTRLLRWHVPRLHAGGAYGAKYTVNAVSEQPIESEPIAYEPKNPWNSVPEAFDAFYRFSRPHTVIGTALSIISVSLLAVEKLSDFSPIFFAGVLQAIVAAFLMNIYIVGLNQLSDIEIDKVNKPYLPLASGEYTYATGVAIVSSFAIMVLNFESIMNLIFKVARRIRIILSHCYITLLYQTFKNPFFFCCASVQRFILLDTFTSLANQF